MVLQWSKNVKFRPNLQQDSTIFLKILANFAHWVYNADTVSDIGGQ